MSAREEWQALVDADTLHLLPVEALVASVQHLARRLLDVTEISEPTMMIERAARRILRQAMDEARCAEFIECLWNGGSATVDAHTGKLVLISGDQLADLVGADDESLGTVIGVFARANHPEGYGHPSGTAHGYVVVIVKCANFDELDEVRSVLEQHRYEPDPDRPGLNRQMTPPGFDPWTRGDSWYAGPYELVWAAEVADVLEARGMHHYGPPLDVGDIPSYGDNRALAYLSAAQVLNA